MKRAAATSREMVADADADADADAGRVGRAFPAKPPP